jgi:myo-inositol 2-dehydrogenase/D-chiro-inositol 1-dehydrogenase
MSLKVGIIGTGVMGTPHAHLLAREVRGCEVVAIADINSARVSQIAHDLAIAATYQDGLELIRSATVEAVLVASSDDTHFRLVSECIRRGKPVLCEKPLATTAEE